MEGGAYGSYSVKSCYALLEGNSENFLRALIKMLWNPNVPSKVSFFAWEVWCGKILTTDQLRRRGFPLASRCFFCNRDEEVLKHILLHCSKIWGLWTTLFSIQGGEWVCPSSMLEFFLGWINLSTRKEDKKFWRMVALCLLWAIWKETNIIVFEDVQFSLVRLKSFFLRTLSSWANFISDMDHTPISLFFCTL